MKKGRNTAETLSGDDELDDIEVSESGSQERTLILKTVPRSRKGELIARGAKEIRCIRCHQIRPLAGAEESEEGWVCEVCVLPSGKKNNEGTGMLFFGANGS